MVMIQIYNIIKIDMLDIQTNMKVDIMKITMVNHTK